MRDRVIARLKRALLLVAAISLLIVGCQRSPTEREAKSTVQSKESQNPTAIDVLPTATASQAPLQEGITEAPPTSAPTERLPTTIPTATPTPIPSPTPIDLPPPAVTRPDAIGRIVIPSLGIDAPIVTVSWHAVVVNGQTVAEWDTVHGAAGHHKGTAKIGEKGNCVLSGHIRGPGEGVFPGLWELKSGDLIVVVDAEGIQYHYYVGQVHKLQEVGASLEQRQENARLMEPTDHAQLTIITCWPEWAYTHRVIVTAPLSSAKNSS